MKIFSVGAKFFHADFHTDGKTGTRTEGMAKLIVVYRYFANGAEGA
jgi:hypothetical protein